MMILSDEMLAEQTKHSPLPWCEIGGGRIDAADGRLVASLLNQAGASNRTIYEINANRALIVEAVNNHARLKEENAALVKELKNAAILMQVAARHCPNESVDEKIRPTGERLTIRGLADTLLAAVASARSALSKATGG